jgi:hypothetical protein
MADVEMKEANKPEEKKNEEAPEAKEPTDNFYELKKVLVLMEKASNEKDYRTCAALTK